MKLALHLLLLAGSAFASEHGERVIPSPDRRLSVVYEWAMDEPTGTDYTHRAILRRGGERVWSFAAKGRAILFSWSPDSRYLVFGVVLAGRDMSLYYLDTQSERPKEHDLGLAAVERRVEAALPELASGGFAGRSQTDFERVEWISASECRLHYFYSFESKSGDAQLRLDLSVPRPTLEIMSITTRTR